MNNSGLIYKYIDKKEGKEVLAVALHEDQRPVFEAFNKTFLRVLNDDRSFKTGEDGKGICALKHNKELNFIGYWN